MSRVDELREQYRTLTKQQTSTTPKTSDKSVEALKAQYRNLTQPKQQTQPVAQQPVVQQPVQPKNNGILSSVGLSGLRAMDNRPAETIPVKKQSIAEQSRNYINSLAPIQQASAYATSRPVVANNQKKAELKKQIDELNKNNNRTFSINDFALDTNFAEQQRHINELAEEVARKKEIAENSKGLKENERYVREYNEKLAELNKATNDYNNALKYDKEQGNMASDIAKSLDTNTKGGMANIMSGWSRTGSKLSGYDATTIDANALYNYMQPQEESDNPYALLGNALREGASYYGTRVMPGGAAVNEALGGGAETPNVAFGRLEDLHKMYPNNLELTNLYNAIASKQYNGTAEDLKKALNDVQLSLDRQFQNQYFQDEYDAVQNQAIRNENKYGGAAWIPNAFGTVGNMIPSILMGYATGGIGELAGGGSMALAGSAANKAQQLGSLGNLGMGAANQGTNQAIAEGADYNQALQYGALTGLTEAGTEMLGGEAVNAAFGQVGKSVLGKLVGKGVDKLGIKSKVGKAIAGLASDIAGEATEEMISEAVNPLWKAATYDADALPKNSEELGQYFKDILNAGLEAIPSTLLMAGGGNVVRVGKVNQIENGILKSIQESDLSPIVKTQLENEVRKASTDVKLGLEESDTIENAANTKAASLAQQSAEMAARIPEGYSLPQSTVDILAYTENNRPGLNIAFDTNIQGNGTFVENPDGTRTITLNPNSKRAVEFTLTHELGHDLKGTGEYTQLQNLLTDYAKGKQGYQEALKSLDQTYRESGANYNLQDEATNDMLGQAIGEQEFYNKLAENPTLFNRVTQGLKNLLGNKESKLKNKIEKLTKNAYQSAYKGTGSNQVQNSLNEKNVVYHGTINNVKGQDLKASNRGDLGEGLYFAREKNIAQNFSDAGFRDSTLEPMGNGRYININTGEIITPEKPQIIEANIDNLNIKQLTPNEWWEEIEKYRDKTTNALPPNYETVAQQKYKNQGYDGLEISGAGMENQIVVFPEAIKKINYETTQPTTDNPDIRYSKQNGQWQQFVQDNFNLTNGTRTNFLPSNEELQQQETDSISQDAQALNLQEPEVKLTESDDDTLFSLSEQEQKEVNNYIDNISKSNSIPENIKNDLINRLNNVNSYDDFKQLVKEVRKYNVSKFAQDRKTAEGTKGQTIKGKDIKEAISKNVGIDKGNRNVIQNTIKAMNQDMIQGNLTDSKIDEYVEQLGDSMKAYATEYYDMYKDFKKELRNTKIYVAPEIKRGITDYNDFRKSNMGNLTLTGDSKYRTPDQVYKELQENYGELLPDDIINPIDQLEHLADVSSGIRIEEGKLRDMLEKQYGSEAWEESAKLLKNDLKQLRDAPKVDQQETDKEPTEKKRRWTETAKGNELVNEFLDVKDSTYVPSANKKQLSYAQAQINKLGYEDAVKYIDGKINLNEKFKAEDIAMGELLIQEAIKKGDFEKAQDLIQDVAIIGTELGQAVQAMSMISRMTPEGQLKYLNKVINKINENIEKKNIKKAEDKQIEPIKLDKDLATNILKATDDVELQQAMDNALQRIADQMPVNLGDKIAEWRYLAMLANPRTHFRNIIANVGMKGIYGTKNQIQRAIEKIASPLLDEKTRTYEKATADVKNFADKTTKELESVLAQTDNKTIEGRIKEMRKVFKFAPLEKIRKLNSDALSWEDNLFTRQAFKNNLAEYLTANGIKTEQDINMNPELVQKGINYAKEEAWKTTFHQASKFATELNRIENINGFSKLIVGGTVPFKKTPVNIAKTGASYSPLGLLETLSVETVNLKNGNINANQYIDRLSQGLTGTMLFGLGTLLSKLGILKAGTDDEDEYAEAIGQTQKFSIRIGNKNYDISWAAPSAMPLLMGAELESATRGKKVSFGDIAETLASTINPLSEMSFVSGFNSTIKSYSNSDSSVDAIGAAIKNSLKSYFGQFVPTIGGQINKIIDDTERSTTATKSSPWKEGESFLRQQVAKIPGASFALEPKTDVWGNEKKRDSNPLVRAFDALVNPGTVTEDRTTEVDKEIMSLIDVLDDNSLRPQIPKNNFKFDNEEIDLTPKEYTTFKKAYGQYMYETYDALLDNEYYNSLEAEDKAKVLKDISTVAKDVAKNEVGYETNGYFKYDVITDELEKAGIPLIDYFLVGRDIKSSDGKNKKQTVIAQVVEAMNDAGEQITKEQKDALRDIFGVN